MWLQGKSSSFPQPANQSLTCPPSFQLLPQRALTRLQRCHRPPPQEDPVPPHRGWSAHACVRCQRRTRIPRAVRAGLQDYGARRSLQGRGWGQAAKSGLGGAEAEAGGDSAWCHVFVLMPQMGQLPQTRLERETGSRCGEWSRDAFTLYVLYVVVRSFEPKVLVHARQGVPMLCTISQS